MKNRVTSISDAADLTAAFALADGGPGAGFLRHLRLTSPEMGVDASRTAALLVAVSWLPLCVLCAFEGLTRKGAQIPFFHDFGAQARLLVGVPLLVFAEVPIGRAWREVLGRMLTNHLIKTADLDRFEALLVHALKQRDSRVAEFSLIFLVYVASISTVFRAPYETGNTWIHPVANDRLSVAGYWYAFVSLPIFQFLAARWVYRISLWAITLRHISRLDLALTPAHPDRAGGIAFVSQSLAPLGIILFALSTVIAATIAERILFDGEKLAEYQWAYLIVIVLLVGLFAGPVFVFTPQLLELKQRGLRQYGELASAHHQSFDARLSESSSEPALAGIESRAALESSFQVVKAMRFAPIDLGDLAWMLAPALLPVIPLLLTVMPAATLLQDIVKVAKVI